MLACTLVSYLSLLRSKKKKIPGLPYYIIVFSLLFVWEFVAVVYHAEPRTQNQPHSRGACLHELFLSQGFIFCLGLVLNSVGSPG